MKAIEAAARALAELGLPEDAPTGKEREDHINDIWWEESEAAEAAIRAYLTALAEDDDTVLKVAQAISEKYGTHPYTVARAAIRAMGGE